MKIIKNCKVIPGEAVTALQNHSDEKGAAGEESFNKKGRSEYGS